MIVHVVSIALALVVQVTPRDLGRRQMLKRERAEPRAGTTHTDLDPPPGFVFAFPSVAARIRAFDKSVTSLQAARIGWPHMIAGKPYDLLGKEDRERLLKMQSDWVDQHGNPSLPSRGVVITQRNMLQYLGRPRVEPEFADRFKPKTRRHRRLP